MRGASNYLRRRRPAGVSFSTVIRFSKNSFVDPEKSGRVPPQSKPRFSPRAAAAPSGKGTKALGLLVPAKFRATSACPCCGASRRPPRVGLRAHQPDDPLRPCAAGARARRTTRRLLLLFADSAGRALLARPPPRLSRRPPLHRGAGPRSAEVTVENEKVAAEAVGPSSGPRPTPIVCLVGPEGIPRRRPVSAATKGRGEAAIPFDPQLVAPGDFQADRQRRPIRDLPARGEAFDAVFGGDAARPGGLRGPEEAGIRAGTEVSVIGFDDLPLSPQHPSVATVRAPTKRSAPRRPHAGRRHQESRGEGQGPHRSSWRRFVPRGRPAAHQTAAAEDWGRPRSPNNLGSPIKLDRSMLKITIIGGGSTYTPELVYGFLKRMAAATHRAVPHGYRRRGIAISAIRSAPDRSGGSPFSHPLGDRASALKGPLTLSPDTRRKMPARRAESTWPQAHLVARNTGVGGWPTPSGRSVTPTSRRTSAASRPRLFLTSRTPLAS